MPVTINNRDGDGVNDAFLDTLVVLPDTGSSVVVAGSVQSPGKALVLITGSPLTAPAVPGSGSVYWNIQVDAGTGAASVQQSTSADPAPVLSADAVTPQVVIFRQTLTFGTSGAQLSGDTSTTPDLPI